MRELVGHCESCQTEVYCVDGFFQGIIQDNGKILCFSCAEKKK